MKLKTNLGKVTAPVQEYRLPSGGLMYQLGGGKEFPGVIQISPFGFTTESVLVSNLSSSDKMSKIVKDICTLPEGFEPRQLLLADQYFILAVARALTYGEDYVFSSKCPSCGFKEKHTLKVPDQIPTRLWTKDPEAVRPDEVLLLSSLHCRLPVAGDVIDFRFLTAEDNENSLKYAEEKRKLEPSQDHAFLRRIAMHIRAVNGTPISASDWHDLEEDYIKKIRGQDMVALRDGIEKMSCGFITDWAIECDNCGHPYTAYIPVTNNFFRRD